MASDNGSGAQNAAAKEQGNMQVTSVAPGSGLRTSKKPATGWTLRPAMSVTSRSSGESFSKTHSGFTGVPVWNSGATERKPTHISPRETTICQERASLALPSVYRER
jgi:hypothetical protein